MSDDIRIKPFAKVEKIMDDSSDLLPQIVRLFDSEDGIDGCDVRTWMKNEDLEIMGAVNVLVREDRFAKRISPALDVDDYREFVPRFLFRCMVENPDSKWTLERFEAGTDLANWFIGLWHDSSIPRSYLAELKSKIAELYSDADESFRRAIIEAPLKQIFEFQEMKDYFKDWENDPSLQSAVT